MIGSEYRKRQHIAIQLKPERTSVRSPLMTICSMSDVTRERAESMKGRYAATALTEDNSTVDPAEPSEWSDPSGGCRTATVQQALVESSQYIPFDVLSSAMLNAALAIVRSLSSSSIPPAPVASESMLFRALPDRSSLLLLAVAPDADGVTLGVSDGWSISASCICNRLVRTTKREVRRRMSEACCRRSSRVTWDVSVWYGVRIF